MIYIALLRGINVGGHKKIKMSELKEALEQAGLVRVQTYIQSGNVLFESEETEEVLQARMEQTIREAFGFEVSIMVRTLEEWRGILAQCPFDTENELAGKRVHAALLTAAPAASAVEALPAWTHPIEKFHINGREIYFQFGEQMQDSKLPNHLMKLKQPMTLRNWNTMSKLAQLAEGMQVKH
ncbi:DUF1697 domain-containing protein [Paenibacillus silviterrae]|uniref:DUF1697 domain-containing protein n=1 Tax=Paenibacillus silviterrae TaxID=3242194 RepID=UPI002543BAC2|nr:DUF1697 domain-containing protein [Paenibacillus chinjuensis]